MWIGAVTHDGGVVKVRLPPEADARLLVRAPGVLDEGSGVPVEFTGRDEFDEVKVRMAFAV